MKALTVRQPFATLLVRGLKQFETRTWYTKHRGLLAVHAAKGRDDWQLETYADPMVKRALTEMSYRAFRQLPFGKVLGTMRLERIHDTGKMSPAMYEGFERRVGNFNRDRYAWQLVPTSRYDEPVPAQGQPGLWDFDKDTHKTTQ